MKIIKRLGDACACLMCASLTDRWQNIPCFLVFAPALCFILPAKARKYFFYRRWFVCLSVTIITKNIVEGFVTNFMGRFLGGKGRLSSCFVTIGRGMWK